MTQIFKLQRRIEAHGEETDTLVLREPNAGDIAATGMPFRFTAEGNVDFHPANIIKLASRLAAVPPSVIERLNVREFAALQNVVFGFFTSDETTGATAEPLQPTAPATATEEVELPLPIHDNGSRRVSTSLGSGKLIREPSSDLAGRN